MRETCRIFETDFHNFPENETMHTNKSCYWVVLPSPGLDTGAPTKGISITRPSEQEIVTIRSYVLDFVEKSENEDRNLQDVPSMLI